ncbi:hypothetical protein AZ49_08850 [Megasphaera elsdenii 14-14]|nr:hypothetical protein AZ49_08850 [Megasphaera elsdenii 14-14]
MYVMETVTAGPVIEVRKYHTSRYRTPSMPRAKKEKKTCAEQWKVNEKNSVRNLRLLILENFGEEDIRLDLTYEGEEPTEEEAKRRFDNFLLTLRRHYRAAGHELKWIGTSEGQGHRPHHHLLVNNIGWGRREYQALWKWGRIPYKAFRFYDGAPEDAERVAKYLVKETRETYCQKERCQRSRYRCSRNLRKPKVEKQVIQSKTWRDPKPKKGYYIEKPVQYGYTAYGFPYMFYRMIREEDSHSVPDPKRTGTVRCRGRGTGKHAAARKKRVHQGR